MLHSSTYRQTRQATDLEDLQIQAAHAWSLHACVTRSHQQH